jgi:hypothetical protein
MGMATVWAPGYHVGMPNYVLRLFSDRPTTIIRPEWQNKRISAATDLEAVKAITSEYADALQVCDRAELRSHDGQVIWRLPANA